MTKLRVGVLRGGPSSEYDVSLLSGQSVLQNLPEKYQPFDILVDKDGIWHFHGAPKFPDEIFNQVDLIFNAMHGEYGEDGKVQQLLESHHVPFTGSRALGSALAMNKVKAKEIFMQAGLKTPTGRILKLDDDEAIEALALVLFRTFPIPLIIKPIGAGSSVGVYFCNDFSSIIGSLTKATEKFNELLIEEYISGKEATVGVIENFRQADPYVLPPIEIRPPKEKNFFDFEAKYGGHSEEICPGNFSQAEKTELMEAGKLAHRALGLRHYSRSDFIIHPRRGIYILETNTLPGLTSESLLPKALKAVGSSLSEFLDHVLTLGRNN